jgi:hypothetical protein
MLLISYNGYYQHGTCEIGDAVGCAETKVVLRAWHLLMWGTCSGRVQRARLGTLRCGTIFVVQRVIEYSDSPRSCQSCGEHLSYHSPRGPGIYTVGSWVSGDQQRIAKDMRSRICGAVLPHRLSTSSSPRRIYQ